MSDFISRTGMFDPSSRLFRPTRRDWRRGIGMAFSALVLGLMLSLGMATPAYTDSAHGGVVLSTKSVAAPQGARGLCARYAWACAGRTGYAAMGAEQKLALANSINRAVNRQVREITDTRQYRRPEYWALPTARGGDCEDFALLKKRELMARGVPGDKLLIATVLDRKRRSHAVLVLRTARGDYVLDNLTSRIKPWQQTGYSFLRMQDPRSPDRWIAVLAGGIFKTAGSASLTRGL